MPKNKILSLISGRVQRLRIVTRRASRSAVRSAIDALDFVANIGADATAKQRIVGGVAIASLFAMVTAVATVRDSAPFGADQFAIEPLAFTAESLAEGVIDGTSTPLYWYEERFGRGDTFAALLARLRVASGEAARVAREPAAAGLLTQLRPGTAVQAQVTGEGKLFTLRFVGAQDQQVGLERNERGGLRLIEKPIRLEREVVARAAYVGNSLFAAADAAGVPDSVAMQLGEVFGSEVDFHRTLRRNDRFTVVFERFNHQGRMVRPGRLLAAEVVQGQRVLQAVWFESGELHGYYTPEGHSLKSAFLRSPLEVSRITSGFEMRFDPRSRQWHAHNGIDYAAPIGTPVRATGDGVVEFAGQQSGYGNVVILKHRGGYTTLYAHMDQIALGLKEHERVAQGQLLGSVGQTGWATGPHLHYEFRMRDEHVDPLNVVLPSATPLDPRALGQFRAHAAPLVTRLGLLRNTTVAALE